MEQPAPHERPFFVGQAFDLTHNPSNSCQVEGLTYAAAVPP